jgi:hypothetical protein
MQILRYFSFVTVVCASLLIPNPGFASSTANVGIKEPYGYITVGGYDGGGQIASFFVPYYTHKNSYAWWDTGGILWGGGVGYRKLFTQPRWDQDWFIGGYFYYDVMNNFWKHWYGTYYKRYKTESLSDQFIPIGVFPTRFNVGAEIAASKLGKLTMNVYGFPFSKETSKFNIPEELIGFNIPEELIGISGSLSLYLNSYVHALFCVSYAGLGSSLKDPHLKKVMRAATGFNIILEANIDCEIKIGWCDKEEKPFVRLGIQFRAMDRMPTHFKQHFHTPPARYLPSYTRFDLLSKGNSKIAPNPPPKMPGGYEVGENRINEVTPWPFKDARERARERSRERYNAFRANTQDSSHQRWSTPSIDFNRGRWTQDSNYMAIKDQIGSWRPR